MYFFEDAFVLGSFWKVIEVLIVDVHGPLFVIEIQLNFPSSLRVRKFENLLIVNVLREVNAEKS